MHASDGAYMKEGNAVWAFGPVLTRGYLPGLVYVFSVTYNSGFLFIVTAVRDSDPPNWLRTRCEWMNQ